MDATEKNFAKAYNLQVGSNSNIYVQQVANNAAEMMDDDSLGSITQSIQQIWLANNTS